jgi:hypothetical protein
VIEACMQNDILIAIRQLSDDALIARVKDAAIRE